MPAAITVPAGLAGYAALISEFPLRPIRIADELARALAVARSLMGGGLDGGESDYLEILVSLIEQYEEKICPISRPTDAEMLRFLLESRGVNQATLSRETGIAESAISEVLSGKKALRRQHIGAIAGYFRVSPAVFRFDRPVEIGGGTG
jgi:HTH-type transcriptional regulator/antitoxin HigA